MDFSFFKLSGFFLYIIYLGNLSKIIAAPSKRCNKNNEYFEELVNRCCTNCQPGSYLKHRCSLFNDTVCAPCQKDHYTDIWHHSSECERCRQDCKQENGLVVVQSCSSSSQLVCDCKPGHSCEIRTFSGSCLSCAANIGNQVTTSSPEKTTFCGPGMFLNGSSGMCQQHKNCVALGKELAVEGNATEDSLCIQKEKQKPDRFSDFALLVTVVGASVMIFLGVIAMLLSKKIKLLGFKRVFKSCKTKEKEVISGIAQVQETQTDDKLLTSGMPSSTESLTNHAAAGLQKDHPQVGPEGGNWSSGVLPQTANQRAESQPARNNMPTDPTNGLLGPLHIYSPGTVFVGLINNVPGHSAETRRGGATQGDSLGDVLRFPQQEQGLLSRGEGRPLQEEGKESHLSREEGQAHPGSFQFSMSITGV
ncbi:tumor necrosis factor receptor superfamily member 1B-like [Polyodon spathula]|uniref:tumor necrosis factor receptor superfamily member 1B-like n=1 Tax=Polyodon spathula TaxID=7913 RepID=UPI001B7F6AF8|nr:tumor necrosis factor receptor superfamily member 1B-like [Polyodon spathula]